MDVSEAQKPKVLEDENARLKRLQVDRGAPDATLVKIPSKSELALSIILPNGQFCRNLFYSSNRNLFDTHGRVCAVMVENLPLNVERNICTIRQDKVTLSL